jgi:hypothetical protein
MPFLYSVHKRGSVAATRWTIKAAAPAEKPESTTMLFRKKLAEKEIYMGQEN